MFFYLQVISGHTGWVRCIDVEPGNEWFVTGSADRVIKVLYCLFIIFLSCKVTLDCYPFRIPCWLPVWTGVKHICKNKCIFLIVLNNRIYSGSEWSLKFCNIKHLYINIISNSRVETTSMVSHRLLVCGCFFFILPHYPLRSLGLFSIPICIKVTIKHNHYRCVAGDSTGTSHLDQTTTFSFIISTPSLA